MNLFDYVASVSSQQWQCNQTISSSFLLDFRCQKITNDLSSKTKDVFGSHMLFLWSVRHTFGRLITSNFFFTFKWNTMGKPLKWTITKKMMFVWCFFKLCPSSFSKKYELILSHKTVTSSDDYVSSEICH